MNSQQISTLSILIDAQAKGALNELQNLDDKAKIAGVGIVKALKASAEGGAAAWDKALNQIATRFAKGVFNPSDMAKLDQLRATFERLERSSQGASGGRSGLINSLSGLAVSRRPDDIPALQNIKQTLSPEIEHAFARLEKLQRQFEGGADNLDPFIAKVKILGSVFENLGSKSLPMADIGLQRTNDLIRQIAAVQSVTPGMSSQVYGPSREGFDRYNSQQNEARRRLMNYRFKVFGDINPFSGEEGQLRQPMYGPSSSDFYNAQEEQRQKRAKRFEDTIQYSGASAMGLGEYGPSREGFINAQRQQYANAALPIFGSPDVTQHQQALNNLTTEIKLASAKSTGKAGSAFKRRLMSEYNSGKDGRRRLYAMRRLISRQQKKGYERQVRDIDSVLNMGPRSSLADLHGIRTGKNSDSRNMRYIAQNLAYGFEDAAISYQTGGLAGAVRGATNNLTAVAGAAIAHPGMAAGTIVGISALAVILPTIAKFIESSSKGTEASKEFEQSLSKLISLRVDSASFFSMLAKPGGVNRKYDELVKFKEDLKDLSATAGALSEQGMGARSMSGRGMVNHTAWRVGSNVLGAARDFGQWFGEGFGIKGTGRNGWGEDAELMSKFENAQGEIDLISKQTATTAIEIANKNSRIKAIQDRMAADIQTDNNRFMLGMERGTRGTREDIAMAYRHGMQENITAAERHGTRKIVMDADSQDFQQMISNPALGFPPEEQRLMLRDERQKHIQGGRQNDLQMALDSIRERQADTKAGKEFNTESMLNSISRDPERAAYANYYRRQESLRKMRGLSEPQRDAIAEGSRLTFELEALAGRVANGPQAEFKPFLDGMDVGSKSDYELFNSFQYGNQKPEDAQRKEIIERLKQYEKLLQGILTNTVPMPVKAKKG